MDNLIRNLNSLCSTYVDQQMLYLQESASERQFHQEVNSSGLLSKLRRITRINLKNVSSRSRGRRSGSSSLIDKGDENTRFYYENPTYASALSESDSRSVVSVAAKEDEDYEFITSINDDNISMEKTGVNVTDNLRKDDIDAKTPDILSVHHIYATIDDDDDKKDDSDNEGDGENDSFDDDNSDYNIDDTDTDKGSITGDDYEVAVEICNEVDDNDDRIRDDKDIEANVTNENLSQVKALKQMFEEEK